MTFCNDCAELLTPTEIYYYESRCTHCVGIDTIRHQQWLDGKDDPELDARYADPPLTKN